MSKMALVLGGGAPNSTLMTGAMLAFDEAGVKFDAYSGAGAGGVMALLYLAPKGMSRQDMLKNTVNLSISDAIFDILPINYRMFQKSGRLAEAYRGLLTKLPFYQKIMNQYGMSRRQKLFSDLIQLAWAATTPMTTTLFSSGMCANATVMKDYIDFDALKKLEEDVYLNAYDVEERNITVFDKSEIDVKTLGASLGYPFIYEAVKINGKAYMEGGAVDTYNFSGLLEYDGDIRTVVVMDAFGNQNYIMSPKNLFDAYCQQLILPLVEVCRKDLLLFEHWQLPKWNEAHPQNHVEMVKISFDIPEKWLPTALDWSTSNMERMFDLGYETGRKHVKKFGVGLGRTIF